MPLYPAEPADHPAIVALVNSGYRGETSRQGWTTEADFLGGQRIDLDSLRRDLADEPGAQVLTLRDAPGGELLGCVWIEPHEAGTWYLGMLTVRPDLQARQLGRTMLAETEAACAGRGAERVRMTVINVRDTLIAWYRRRGYEPTGETEPFPYGDPRFGEPLRDDLQFVVLEKRL